MLLEVKTIFPVIYQEGVYWVLSTLGFETFFSQQIAPSFSTLKSLTLIVYPLALFQHPRTSVSLHNLFVLYSLFSLTSKALSLTPYHYYCHWIELISESSSFKGLEGHLCAKWSLCTEVVWWNKRLRQCRCFCTVTVFSSSGMGAGFFHSTGGWLCQNQHCFLFC